MSTTQTTKLKTTAETPQQPDKPSRPRPEWVEDLLGYPRRSRKFLQDVRAEMKLVVWPSAPDVRSTTLVVIMTTILFAFFLWGVDKASLWGVSRILKVFTH